MNRHKTPWAYNTIPIQQTRKNKMRVIADILSVSNYDDDDDDNDAHSVGQSTIEEEEALIWFYEQDEDEENILRTSVEGQEQVRPVNRHIFFDDEGNEISAPRNQEFVYSPPPIHHTFHMRHPRVIIDFLRFITSYNEVATGDDVYMIPVIPASDIDYILSHPLVTNAPPQNRMELENLLDYYAEVE